MKKFTSCICNNANSLVLRARTALSNQRGDFYISDAVKIIIAVVLRRAALAALTLIIHDTVIPRDHPGDRGSVRLSSQYAGVGLWISTTSPRFLFFKKRITEVQDEYTLQILFLSACHWKKLALRPFLSPVIVRSAHMNMKNHARVFCLPWMSAGRSCCCLPNRFIS